MKSLSEQFKSKINKQLAIVSDKGAKFMAGAIIEKMKENVDRGVAFDRGEDKYKRKYAARTVKERKQEGYRYDYADLQRGNKRVKTAYVDESVKDGGRIRFAQGGDLMMLHNWGIDKRLPRRQLFPDIEGGGKNSPGTGELQQADSIPKKIVKDTEIFGAKLMNKPL